MSNVIRIKKGLDIKLVGTAEKVLVPQATASRYALCPSDFEGVTPKLLAAVGDKVMAGDPLFFDKYRPNLVFTSPVSGEVTAINRGEKRRILEIVVTPDGQSAAKTFEIPDFESLPKERIIELMLASGLWPIMIKRPFGIIADEKEEPKSIFISLFDTAPLAPDLDFILYYQKEEFMAGLRVLSKLTKGAVNVGINAQVNASFAETIATAARVTAFEGKHPAGCVGVQINKVDPIAKGDVIWTIGAQNVALLGRFFTTGKVDFSKIVAVAGSEVKAPKYFRMTVGACLDSVLADNIKPQEEGRRVRIINGNVLTGTKTPIEGYLGFYNDLITVIPEGDRYAFLGWIAPRTEKFSMSHSYLSWLMPGRKYALDTNLNGGHRALVVSGEYDKVVPMDIYPVYLIKAILAEDIDKMENLGIYEVIEEDLALCDFVCTSKTEVQDIVRNGIRLMLRELN